MTTQQKEKGGKNDESMKELKNYIKYSKVI